jgi:hypothetical protein
VSNYRPITDVWILARPKVAYYGAYPNGLLERARVLLGVTIGEPLLHVCGGMARRYPGTRRGFGPYDQTLDLDPVLQPDYLQDAREPLPWFRGDRPWPALLADRPYTAEDSSHYSPGPDKLPGANELLRSMLAVVRPGGRVGMIDYFLPRPPSKGVDFVACVGVVVGFGNRMRVFSVFERGVDYEPAAARARGRRRVAGAERGRDIRGPLPLPQQLLPDADPDGRAGLPDCGARVPSGEDAGPGGAPADPGLQDAGGGEGAGPAGDAAGGLGQPPAGGDARAAAGEVPRP